MKFAEPVEERAGAQERLAPEEAEALGDLRAQRRAVGLTLLLERRPHREQRDVEKAYEIASKRNGSARAEPEERAAERRPAELHRRLARPSRRPRRPGSWRAGTTARRAPACAAPKNVDAGPLDERDDRDRPERDVGRARSSRRGTAIATHADGVGGDHQVLAVPAVGCDPGEQRPNSADGEQPREARRARPSQASASARGRAAGRRSSSTACPALESSCPACEQHEVAVSPQRNRAHSPSVSRVSEAEGDSGESRPLGESGTEEAVSLVREPRVAAPGSP